MTCHAAQPWCLLLGLQHCPGCCAVQVEAQRQAHAQACLCSSSCTVIATLSADIVAAAESDASIQGTMQPSPRQGAADPNIAYAVLARAMPDYALSYEFSR